MEAWNTETEIAILKKGQQTSVKNRSRRDQLGMADVNATSLAHFHKLDF